MSKWPGTLGELERIANSHLEAVGWIELAFFAWDEGAHQERVATLLVAADGGILQVVQSIAPPGMGGPGADVWQTTAEPIPWAEVRGARLYFTQIGHSDPELHVAIDYPEFDQARGDTTWYPALLEFGNECLMRVGWQSGQRGDANEPPIRAHQTGHDVADLERS